jgi:hypothetical protein
MIPLARGPSRCPPFMPSCNAFLRVVNFLFPLATLYL